MKARFIQFLLRRLSYQPGKIVQVDNAKYVIDQRGRYLRVRKDVK